MTNTKHVEGFLEAVLGKKGELDAWLEVNNEEDVRQAVLGAIALEREYCALACEGAIEKGSPITIVAQAFAQTIRMRGIE